MNYYNNKLDRKILNKINRSHGNVAPRNNNTNIKFILITLFALIFLLQIANHLFSH